MSCSPKTSSPFVDDRALPGHDAQVVVRSSSPKTHRPKLELTHFRDQAIEDARHAREAEDAHLAGVARAIASRGGNRLP